MTEHSTNIERIMDWIDGRLPAESAALVAAEVAADPVAGELAGLYRSARATVAGDASEAPSEALMQRLRAIGASSSTESALSGRLAALLEDLAALPRAVAALVHDSRRAQPGLRGGAAAPDAATFMSAWSDGEIVVELQVDRRADAWSVLGQVSREDGADLGDGATAEIRFSRLDGDGDGDGSPAGDGTDSSPDGHAVQVDEGGVFETTLAGGTWAVLVVLPGRVVVIERLMLAGDDTATG